MNNLSWLMYFAGVCGNIQGVFIFFAIIAGVFTAGSGLIWIFTFEEYGAKTHERAGKLLARFALPALFASPRLLHLFLPKERCI